MTQPPVDARRRAFAEALGRLVAAAVWRDLQPQEREERPATGALAKDGSKCDPESPTRRELLQVPTQGGF